MLTLCMVCCLIAFACVSVAMFGHTCCTAFLFLSQKRNGIANWPEAFSPGFDGLLLPTNPNTKWCMWLDHLRTNREMLETLPN